MTTFFRKSLSSSVVTLASTARFEPDSTLQLANDSLREEDSHFRLLEAMAAGEDGLVDLTDGTIVPELDLATSVPAETSSPTLLSDEDLDTRSFHPDHSLAMIGRAGIGHIPSMHDVMRRTGQTIEEFDGLTSVQSEIAAQWGYSSYTRS